MTLEIFTNFGNVPIFNIAQHYLGFTFTSNNCDDEDILKQMRMLYCRSNRIVRLFSKCSRLVLLELCRSFYTVFYCPYIWTNL